jgi:CRISPR/Cas system CMR-associated protein Cmr1 (group 7 of RAMP superfamily)
MRYLFVEEGIIEEYLYNELLLAKELRVDTQYYMTDQIDIKTLKTNSQKARQFVLKIEEISESIKDEKINIIINKLKLLINN